MAESKHSLAHGKQDSSNFSLRRLAASLATRPRLKLRAGSLRRGIYQNLRDDEFRLIDVHGSDEQSEGRLRCYLRLERLSAFPDDSGYVAVSYTWTDYSTRWGSSDAAAKASVTVNGHDLPAGRRLQPMIRSLYNCRCKTLWIDALCIDQDDFAERGDQVPKMREIYSKADKVLILLGASSPYTSILFDFLNHADMSEAKLNDGAFRGLVEILENPYWKRAWIIQEVSFGRRVELLCGDQSCSWESFVSLFYRWDVVGRLDELSVGTSAADREIRAIDSLHKLQQQPLLSVLAKTQTFKATDPLDTIYAKLGLAQDAHELVPQLSYKISAVRLFKQLVKSYVEQKMDLYIICLITETSGGLRRLPSWTPDWTLSTERVALLRFFFSGWMGGEHKRHPRMSAWFSLHTNELWVRGAIVESVGSYAQSDDKSGWLQQEALSVFPAICRTAVPDHFVLPASNAASKTSDAFIDQFAILASVLDAEAAYVTGNEQHDKSSATAEQQAQLEDFDAVEFMEKELGDSDTTQPMTSKFRNWYELNCSSLIGTRSVQSWAALYIQAKFPNQPIPPANPLRISGIERSLAMMGYGRRLVGTVLGRPALVPDNATSGDLICLLYGCPVPVVLRKTSKFYTLIGECYVDDFMDDSMQHTSGSEEDAELIFILK